MLKRLPKWADYEIIEIGNGSNSHRFLRKPIDTTLYKNSRFVESRSIVDRIKKRVRFVVVLNDGQVGLAENVKITSELLYIAETSTALKNALSQLFKKPLGGIGGKKIIFVGIVAIVITVAYFVYSGQIKIGDIIGGGG